jgi:hypothetical protein
MAAIPVPVPVPVPASFPRCQTYAKFINIEHANVMSGTQVTHPNVIDAKEWVIFGTKWDTLSGSPNNILSTDGANGAGGIGGIGVARGVPAPGVWGALSQNAVAGGITPGLARVLYSKLRLNEANTLPLIQGMPPLNRTDVSIIVGKIAPQSARLVPLFLAANDVGRNLRMAQLSLPDAATNIAAKDLIADISRKTFEGKLTIFLNQNSICCKTFYDFICKMTDIIYDKSKIDIWIDATRIIENGVKTGTNVVLTCDGVALTCKNGLSTAKHSMFTEELSYMYSEVVRLLTNHTNMLNSSFMVTNANRDGSTPLETALNKFKNFLVVLLRYDYMITGTTDARKERFRLQAADALFKGANYMNNNDNYDNYLYNTDGYNSFFTNVVRAGSANGFSFFPRDVAVLLAHFLDENGPINPTNINLLVGGVVVTNLLRGITHNGAGRNNQGIVNPDGTNAGGIPGGTQGYHAYFAGSAIQANNTTDWTRGNNAAHGRLNMYNYDMSIVGTRSEIYWTCERIADPKGRYGINGTHAGLGIGAATLHPSAKGLTYNQFMILILTQLMCNYDNIIIADIYNVPGLPTVDDADATDASNYVVGVNAPYVTPATSSLLARTYYMSKYPTYFRSSHALPYAVGVPTVGIHNPNGSTPIAQSIVRYMKACLS